MPTIAHLLSNTMDHSLNRRPSRCKIISALFFALTLSLSSSYSQSPTHALQGELDKLSKKLEPKQDKEPEAKVALSAIRQLKLALSESNPILIESLSGSVARMPLGKYQAETQELVKEAFLAISHQISKQKELWTKQVNDYVQEVEQACIKGTPAAQLELLLVTSDKLTRFTPGASRSSYRRSGDESVKLNASIQLLQQWLVFKRLEEKGYIKQAHDKLKSLARSTLSYPILDKAFLDDKIAKIKDSMGEGIERTTRGENLSKIQKDALKKLEKGKLDARLLAEAANTLNALPYSHDMSTKYNDRFYLAIQALADCLHFIEIEDAIKAREKFSEFASESHSLPQLEKIREQAVFKLIPLLYAKIGAREPKAEQRLEAYVFELIGEPGSIEDAEIHNDLITFYYFLTPNSSYHSKGKAHKWKESARKQYSLLGSAATSLKSEDYSFALKQFRAAQELASLAGPANASKLIKQEIEKLAKLKPKLFETSVTSMAYEIESLQNQVEKLKKEATDLRRRR